MHFSLGQLMIILIHTWKAFIFQIFYYRRNENQFVRNILVKKGRNSTDRLKRHNVRWYVKSDGMSYVVINFHSDAIIKN